jgi:hypothetical protein
MLGMAAGLLVHAVVREICRPLSADEQELLQRCHG